MHFHHPIKGVLRLFKKDANCASHVIAIDTKESETLHLSLGGIAQGDWNLVLNWEYEEKQFSYNRNIFIG